MFCSKSLTVITSASISIPLSSASVIASVILEVKPSGQKGRDSGLGLLGKRKGAKSSGMRPDENGILVGVSRCNSYYV